MLTGFKLQDCRKYCHIHERKNYPLPLPLISSVGVQTLLGVGSVTVENNTYLNTEAVELLYVFKEFFKRVIPKKRFQNVDRQSKKEFTVGEHVNHLKQLLLRKLVPTL